MLPTIAAAQPLEDRERDRAKFSGKRLTVEIIGGELTGILSTALTFNALCNGTDCLGSALSAYAVDFAITPLAVWGIGSAMGGQGSLGYSYLGGSLALTAFSVTGSPDETPSDTLSRVSIEAYVAAILLAPCSSLMYELTSQVTWAREHQVGISIRAVDNTTGGVGVISGRF
ncbi:MAG TPA: hypothetical protein VGC41_09960 [Kofleriaceae bacterium]